MSRFLYLIVYFSVHYIVLNTVVDGSIALLPKLTILVLIQRNSISIFFSFIVLTRMYYVR